MISKSYMKIAISMTLSYVISSYLSATVFINPMKPHIDTYALMNAPAHVVTQIKTTFAPSHNTVSKSNNFFSRFIIGPISLLPSATPIPSPTHFIEPTRTESVQPTPTAIPQDQPTATSQPTQQQATPTTVINQATNTPTPTRIIPTATQRPNPPTATSTPRPTQPPVFSCPSSSSESYGSISRSNENPKTVNAESDPDVNLHIRGYTATSADKNLVNYGGDTDYSAPQLTGLISGSNNPQITSTYRVYDWNWSNNTKGGVISKYPVTLIGLNASPGNEIKLPPSQYKIGDGYEAMVLYAETNSLTLKYTREDNVVKGYTIHLDDICVDPNLLNRYRELNANGRGSLPAIRPGQKIGNAKSEVKVAVRDTGEFMDPRSEKDWWAN